MKQSSLIDFPELPEAAEKEPCGNNPNYCTKHQKFGRSKSFCRILFYLEEASKKL